ncbi:MAG TPA: DUF4160 domain-containing protein [Longimicrobium sp.]|jgi:hypothetical protein|uniref:DUF4160 domain-containing protein n=1 Tax=Longimicrobium sp. TaxID=2029185 RepID=UPI002EDA07DC
MGKVDCVSWPGCEVWFWSKDHREPHFHVAAPGSWEIRVFFGPEPPVYDVVMEIGRIPRRRLKEFLKQVSTNREKLYREWDTKVIVED